MSDRGDLVRAYQSGRLLEAIRGALSPDQEERTRLVSDLASLHNEGLLDLVAAFNSLSGDSANGPDFFVLRHVFEQVLPDLEAPVPKLTRCVMHLYREAGVDMATGTILDAFQKFCSRQADRSRVALGEIEANPDELADLLVPVLVAGSEVDPSTYVAEAIRLSRHASIELRRRALFALGRLDEQQIMRAKEEVAELLDHVVDAENDDAVLASTVKSAFTLSLHDAANKPRWVAVIKEALSMGGERAMHAASWIFGFHTGELSTDLLELLLEFLLSVNPSNKGTIDNIDYGVRHLLLADHVEEALCLLEDLVRAHPDKSLFSDFDDTMRAIRDDPALRSKVATRWLLRGEAQLCDGLNSIVDSSMDRTIEVEVDADELANADPFHFVFAARKAIGFLFLKPISVASFLLSLIRHAPDPQVRADIASLVLNPLLLNFRGNLPEYLEQKADSEEEELKAVIRGVLEDLRGYLDALRSIGEIPALQPSLEHREAYHRHVSKEMAESLKKAQEESVLPQLVSRSVLLYGRKAVHHVFGPEGEIRRGETLLGKHGTQIEVPRMTTLDPLGLDFMLQVFRNERPSS